MSANNSASGDAAAIFRSLKVLTPEQRERRLHDPQVVAVIGTMPAWHRLDKLNGQRQRVRRIAASAAIMDACWCDGVPFLPDQLIGQRRVNQLLRGDKAGRVRRCPGLTVSQGMTSFGIDMQSRRMLPTPCAAYEDYWDTMDVWRAVWLCTAERENRSKIRGPTTTIFFSSSLDAGDINIITNRFNEDVPAKSSNPELEDAILGEIPMNGEAPVMDEAPVKVRRKRRLVTDVQIAHALYGVDVSVVHGMEREADRLRRETAKIPRGTFPSSVLVKLTGGRAERHYSVKEVADWWELHAADFLGAYQGELAPLHPPPEQNIAVS